MAARAKECRCGQGGGWSRALSLLLIALLLVALPAQASAGQGQALGKPIVFVGDSLTHQCDWARLLGRTDVDNQGIDGEVSAGVLWRLPGIIARQPAKVFIMIGINDLRRGRGRPEVAEEVLANHGRIMDRLRAGLPQARVHVLSILPVSRSFFSFLPDNLRIMEVNRRLRDLAAGKGCAFLDLYPMFIDKEGALDRRYTYDGLHLNAQGYQVWKQALAPYL